MFAVADGDTVVAWDFGLQTRRLNLPLDAWERLPDLPIEAMDCYPSGHAHAGRVVAILCNRAALLDSEGTQWEALQLPGPLHTAVEVWTGTELILWGLDDSTEPAQVVGLRYHPEPEQ